MARPIIIASAFSVALLASGCASMLSGTTQSVSIEAIADGRPVHGATCRLSNTKGNWVVSTPGSATINKAHGDLQVSCAKEEFAGVSTHSSSFNPQTILGILLDGGIFSIPTDLIAGGAWTYPTSFTTQLQPSSSLSRNNAAPVGSGGQAAPLATGAK